MGTPELRIVMAFGSDDLAWMRLNKVDVPRFWSGHAVPPQRGDMLRIAGRQFEVLGRIWEQDDEGPVLRLFIGDAHAQSDTVFG